MTTKDPDLDRELALLFAEGAATGEHPEADELFAYLAGELGEEDRERLVAHLEGCRRCTALLVEIEPLAAPDPPREDGVADLADAAAWRSMKARLVTEKAATARPPRRGRGLWQAAAAVFFAATVLLAWRVAELSRSVDELAAPRANVPILYAEPTREEADRVLVMPEDVDLLVLALTASGGYPSYSVEIADAEGEVLWTQAGLRATDYDTVRLVVTRRFLGPGRYRILLFGAGETGRDAIDDYPLEVR